MSDQEYANRPPPAGQTPYGQPPGVPPGAPGNMPYGPPPGGNPPPAYPPPYGAPPAPGAPPYAQSPYPGAPPPAVPPPYPGAPYPPPYPGAPYAPVSPPRRRRVWPIVVGIVGGILALVIIAAIAFGIWYAHLTTSVSQIDFAHGFDTASKQAVNVTTTFKATDPEIYCVVRLNVNKNSPTVKFVWTAVDVTTATNQHITNQQINTQQLKTTDENIIYNSIKRTGPTFATGTYKVDVYLNDQLAKTAQFTVTA